MDKLVEREDAPRPGPSAAPALAVQFFLIPLAVVAVVVAIYAGFRMMMADERTAEDYLVEIQTTRGSRRWPAAYELSRRLADPELQKRSPGVGPALVKAFQESDGDDPTVRRYLALAIGRLSPAPAGATGALVAALPPADAETRIAIVWALGATGDPAAIPEVQKLYGSDDAGVRKVVVYALGVLPGDSQVDTLRTALNDPAPDVQWNAAVALAEDGIADGVPVLRRMLDREYVRKTVTRTTPRDATVDPVGDVMISGVRAASRLKASELHEPVAALSRDDDSLKVRQAALEALRDWPR
ncbi:MAG: HEAT repeat domain-containing protein, partial [Vicinamibacterales bacterium]